MSGSRLRPYLGPVIALLVVLALGAGTVYAAIPNGSGTYYACLTKSSGVVRLINYPKVKCATGERFIKWSQQGPAGAAGRAGTQGRPGTGRRVRVEQLGRHRQQARRLRRWSGRCGQAGYVSATQPTTYTVRHWRRSSRRGIVFADVPIGTDVELTIIPEPGKHLEMGEEYLLAWARPRRLLPRSGRRDDQA